VVGGVAEEEHADYCACEGNACDVGLGGGLFVCCRIDSAEHGVDWADDLDMVYQ
jgi:hypothetical protein